MQNVFTIKPITKMQQLETYLFLVMPILGLLAFAILVRQLIKYINKVLQDIKTL